MQKSVDTSPFCSYNYMVSWGCSSPGRALEWHSRGSGFDPHHLHQRKTVPAVGWCGFSFVPRERMRERTGRRLASRKKASGGRLFSPRVDPHHLRQRKTVPAVGWCGFSFVPRERMRGDAGQLVATSNKKRMPCAHGAHVINRTQIHNIDLV